MSFGRSSRATCQTCGAEAVALRRGRCPVCYLRWADSRPVGMGASCIVCGDRRRDDLHLVEYQQHWVSMCHNCTHRVFRMQRPPGSLAALRLEFARERRGDERRIGKRDRRIFQINRRASERRCLTVADGEYLDAAELIIEALENPVDGEATRIAEIPALTALHDNSPEN